MLAYHGACAVCSLRHVELLDAAHIIEDKDENGLPELPNGLSLCKIHHAAYDRRFLGITRTMSWRSTAPCLMKWMGPCSAMAFRRCTGDLS